MADQFGLPVTKYAEACAFQATSRHFSTAAPCFPRQRPRTSRRGFAKEEPLLAGLAAPITAEERLARRRQIPRLGEPGTRFVPQGGTQIQPRGGQSAGHYIRSACPNAEVFVHPHTGETGADRRGVRDAARGEAPWRSSFIGTMRRSRLSTRRRTTNDGLPLLSNNCSRTFIDTKRRRIVERLYRYSLREKGTVERGGEGDDRADADRKSGEQYPNLVDHESNAVPSRRGAAPMPRDRRRVGDIGQAQRSPASCAPRFDAAVQRIERNRARSADAHRHAARAQHLLDGPFIRTYLEALGVDHAKQNRCLNVTRRPARRWQEGGGQSIDPAFRARSLQAHVHNLLFHHHTEKKPLTLIFFLILAAFAPGSWRGAMDKTSCPIVAGHRRS